jgi:hypothetical protein
MWNRVLREWHTDVLNEPTESIFKLEKWYHRSVCLTWYPNWTSVQPIRRIVTHTPPHTKSFDTDYNKPIAHITPTVFYVHVTVHRNKFLYTKTNQIHQFPTFTPTWNSTCFGQFLCPSWVYSMYIRHWYMSYRFEDSFRAGPGWKCSSILVLLENCMTYTIADCTVNKLLMTGRRTAWNM